MARGGLTVRELKRVVASMKKGESVYVNALFLTEKGVECLKKMIEEKVLTVDGSELAKYIVPAARWKFRAGKSICPQMTYIKL